MGISYGTIYPDLIGLSKELSDRFFFQKEKPEIADSKFRINTEVIKGSNYLDLNQKYHDFLKRKMQEKNFRRLEKTHFWKEDREFFYYVSYWVQDE